MRQKYYVKEQTMLIKELCKDMEIEVIGIEKKLFSSYYSKVAYKMEIETGLLVALSSGEGGGGHLFKRTACLTL